MVKNLVAHDGHIGHIRVPDHFARDTARLAHMTEVIRGEEYVRVLAAHRAANRAKHHFSHTASAQAAVESPLLSVSLQMQMQMQDPLASFNSKHRAGARFPLPLASPELQPIATAEL